MASKTSKKLERALRSDCAHSYEMVLAKKNPQDFRALRKLLEDSSITEGQRSSAMFLLGNWGDKKAVDSILRVMPHLSQAENITAIDALGRLGTAKALKALKGLTDNRSAEVRKFVAHALGRIGTPRAVEELRSISKHDPAAHIRKTANKYLSK